MKENCILCHYQKLQAVYLEIKLNNIKYTSLAFTIRNITFMSQECPDSHVSSHVYLGTYVHWMDNILSLTSG